MSFVLDASIALSWCLPDETAPVTDSLFERLVDEGASVPEHWFVEIANAVLTAERRGRLANADATAFLARMAVADLDVDETARASMFDKVVPLARAHRLTAYDAAYLEVAERRGLPLATLDQDLAAAARRVGVDVLGGTAA